MACSHPPTPGYAFCATCGQPSSAPRCACGFVGTMGDRFCGRCGRDLQAVQAEAGAGSAVPLRPGRPDLAALAAQAAADQALAAPSRQVKLKQDDISQLIAKRRGKA